MALILRNLLRQRRLLLELVRRDVRGRYSGARAGILWSLLNPVVQLTAYAIILTYVYRGQEKPGLFVASLFCGLWPWWALQEGTTRGTLAILEQATLLRRVAMPVELCVASAVIASVGLQMIGMIFFLVLFVCAGVLRAEPSWLALPAVGILHLGFTLALALCLAPLQVVLRDTIQFVNAFLTVGFFASPVLYDGSSLPETLQIVLVANPAAALIELFRWAILPDHAFPTIALAWLAATTLLALKLAAWLLKRLTPRLDEYL